MVHADLISFCTEKFTSIVQLESVLVLDVEHASGVNKEEINIEGGRDVWYQDVIPSQPDECAPEWVDSEHPLFPSIHVWVDWAAKGRPGALAAPPCVPAQCPCGCAATGP